MNREIKFRGKSIKTGEWEYGSLLTNRLRFHVCIMINGYINNDTNFYKIRVKSETVGQFTGLRDKNGKDIYEGDFILWEGVTAIVCYEQGAFYALKNGGGLILYMVTSGEIIGNIHDNPELLPIKIN